MDEVFKAKSNGKTFALIRHVDDVWIGATSYSEAELLLYMFRECLREFELDINELKTSVMASARALEPIWPLSLKRLIHNDFRALKAEDKTRVLSDIFRLAQDEKDDGILKYAIRRFDRERMWAQYWHILQSFLMRAVISFPHTIDYVARVLSWTKRKGVNIDPQWRGALLDAFEQNSNLGNDSEVCWLLWCMSELELGIPDELIDVLLVRCGAFPIVMFLHITRTGEKADDATTQDAPRRYSRPHWPQPFYGAVLAACPRSGQ